MPAHDWKRVRPGIFHDFHSTWVVEVRNALNSGILPAGYYALAEQILGRAQPDVIALELLPREGREEGRERAVPAGGPGGLALALPPPKAAIVERLENPSYPRTSRTIIVRHEEGHEVVALIEIISPGNKASRVELEGFLAKVCAAFERGLHLLIVDLFAPGTLDSGGLHRAIWMALGREGAVLPAHRTLLAAAYERSFGGIDAYVEPFAVGERVPSMPLFLRPGYYVNVPLEEIYSRAFASVPAVWRAKVENPPG